MKRELAALARRSGGVTGTRGALTGQTGWGTLTAAAVLLRRMRGPLNMVAMAFMLAEEGQLPRWMPLFHQLLRRRVPGQPSSREWPHQ